MAQININRAVQFQRRLPDRLLFLWYGSGLFTIITFFLIYFKIRPRGDFQAALHYNVLIGVDNFGRGAVVYAIPAASLLILILNAVLYRALARRERFLGFLASLVTFLVSFVLLAAALFLLKVN